MNDQNTKYRKTFRLLSQTYYSPLIFSSLNKNIIDEIIIGVELITPLNNKDNIHIEEFSIQWVMVGSRPKLCVMAYDDFWRINFPEVFEYLDEALLKKVVISSGQLTTKLLELGFVDITKRSSFDIHDLKTHPEPFSAIRCGVKKYEIRKNDRNFKVDDILRLQEYNPETNKYTGQQEYCKISYITPGGGYGLPSTLCVLSIDILK
jgi:hypothetical protein